MFISKSTVYEIIKRLSTLFQFNFYSHFKKLSTMDPTMAEVKLFAGNFAPLDWAYCDGRLLSIEENTALYSLIGTMYGGDGQRTFALPDLRGRVPVGTGQGAGLSMIDLGEVFGTERITLTAQNMPAHSHSAAPATVTVNASSGSGSTLAGSYWGTSSAPAYNGGADSTLMSANAVQVTVAANATGGGQPFDNMQPYLALNYIICLYGIYPSRN